MIHHSEQSTRASDQTTSNFLVYNLQLPPGRHGHHGPHSHGGHGDHVGHGGHVGHGVLGGHGGQDRTGQDGTGRDGTKLTFKLDFPGIL